MGYWAQIFLNTSLVVFGVVFFALFIGVPLAWLIERSRLPGQRFLRSVLPLTYAIPSYLLAMAWIISANPRVGWFNVIFRNLSGGNEALFNVYSMLGIILVESSALYSIVFLNLSSGLKQLDPALEEAARICGASPFKTLTRITLPLMKKTIIASVLSVALASLASFGVPAMLGGPARIQVFTTGIFSLIKQGNPEAFHQALTLSLIVAGLSLLVIVLLRKLTGRDRTLASSRISRHSQIDLGKWTFLASTAVWGFWIVVMVLPLVILLLASFQNHSGPLKFDDLGLGPWNYVLFTLQDFRPALRNSLMTSGISALLILIVGFALAIFTWRASLKNLGRRRIYQWIDDVLTAIYSLPGTVLALILIIIASSLSRVVNLNDTLTLLVLAYFLKYFALAFKTLLSATFMIHPSLIEASQLSGARAWDRVRWVWLPLLKGPLLSALALVLMPTFAELTMSILLYGPGTATLGVLLFQLQEYADRSSASVLGVLVLLFVALLQWIAGRIQKIGDAQ